MSSHIALGELCPLMLLSAAQCQRGEGTSPWLPRGETTDTFQHWCEKRRNASNCPNLNTHLLLLNWWRTVFCSVLRCAQELVQLVQRLLQPEGRGNRKGLNQTEICLTQTFHPLSGERCNRNSTSSLWLLPTRCNTKLCWRTVVPTAKPFNLSDLNCLGAHNFKAFHYGDLKLQHT